MAKAQTEISDNKAESEARKTAKPATPEDRIAELETAKADLTNKLAELTERFNKLERGILHNQS